jgi:hypothetical protein
MFVNFDLVAYLIDFILEKQSPLNIYAKKYSLGTKSNPLNFSSGISIILFFVKHVLFYLFSRTDLLEKIIKFQVLEKIAYSI